MPMVLILLIFDRRCWLHIWDQNVFSRDANQCIWLLKILNPALSTKIDKGSVYRSTFSPVVRQVYVIFELCLSLAKEKCPRMMIKYPQQWYWTQDNPHGNYLRAGIKTGDSNTLKVINILLLSQYLLCNIITSFINSASPKGYFICDAACVGNIPQNLHPQVCQQLNIIACNPTMCTVCPQSCSVTS